MVAGSNLEVYFFRKLLNIVRAREIDNYIRSIKYISQLLTGFSEARNLVDIKKQAASLILLRSLDRDDVLKLKNLGDSILFLSGWFPRFFLSQPNGIKYYLNIGSLAYQSAFNKFPKCDALCDLSSQYTLYSDIIFELRIEGSELNYSDIEWLISLGNETRSKCAAKELSKLGLYNYLNLQKKLGEYSLND